MKTFFYSASKNNCSNVCTASRCSCRCIERLNDLGNIGELTILSAGSNLNCNVSMQLRSGDPIILYASDLYGLDELLSVKEIFDPFKVLLVLGSDYLLSHINYHLLKPRYTTFLQGNFDELGAVLWKMSEKYYSANHNKA